MGRIFAFGCSFTSYHWPTWADIYAHDNPDKDYYNYAAQGLGNVAISTLVLEADLRYNFTEEDEILILWSGVNRNDIYYTHRRWDQGSGSVLHLHPPYDKNYIDKFWCLENDYIKTMTSMIYVNKLYNKFTKIQDTIVEKSNLDNEINATGISTEQKQNLKKIKYLYEPELPKMKRGFHTMYYKKDYFKRFNDTHPEIKDHINFLKTHGIKISNSTVEYFLNMDNYIIAKVAANRHNKDIIPKLLIQNNFEWDRGKHGDRI